MIYHHNVTNSEVSEIQTWALYSRKIITFQNKANLNLFLEIFKKDAERLISHFVFDCDRKVIKFLTYLTTEQYNTLLVYIVKLEPQNTLK